MHDRNNGLERLVYDRYLRAETDVIIEIDDVVGTHPDASIAGWSADVSLFRRAVNVNGARISIRILRSRPRSQMMRVTIGSRPGELGCTISPVRRRSLKTAPEAAPSPILVATSISPSGVR
jgi:hypothetical protein